MKIFNTMSRSLEEFTPGEKGQVRMYTCGPTVYDYAHIGNFRAYMFEDILRRYLKYNGYAVTQVMNFTDVDDKTIRGAREKGVPLAEYTQVYKDAFFTDLDALYIERAEQYPEATKHIDEMIDLIAKLFECGYAYKSDDGSVYYNVGKFEEYGKLAHLDKSGLKSGARVAQDEYDKENVADFALWKAEAEGDGDAVWDSPWGRGRPGWHIECSAMSMKYLGSTFDIHTGGVDNIFPHHENEIAQSEGANGTEYVKYWMHCGYLIVDGQKMSKSLGNFYALREILEKGYLGREVRYVLLSAQYRQSLNFTFSALDAARVSLGRIDEFCTRLDEAAGDTSGSLPAWAEDRKVKFIEAMDDDLNVPEALGVLFALIHDANKAMDDGSVSPEDAGAVRELLTELDAVLGIISSESEDGPDAAALALAEERQKFRAEKNWAESDRMRDELLAMGWVIKDTHDGPKLRKST